MSEITVFLKQVFLGICGLSFGLLASAGVFTVLVSVGLIPRFAGKMHVAKKVFALEDRTDRYEDELGSYLVKLGSRDLSEKDSYLVSTLLHCIGDFERISDHAVNVAQTA